ncbi:uncharacterized protein LOC127768115 [Oryza glaberrima]|uniref:ZCF37 n=1 Tax=Oryza glaberrima TaxID=4538 RepID=I1PCI8_ORYGL|nr:uncharacterized protein LOC127768115 [Oryza glaberrima]
MLCGTASFKHVVDDDDPAARGTGGGSPRQPRRKHGGGGGGKINPYAERGLDKFSTVLSELEARRDKILRRVGSGGGLVMVRFVQSNGALEPIIVKLPDEQRRPKDDAAAKKPRPSSPSTAAAQQQGAAAARATRAPPPAPAASRASSFSWGRMRRPACYWPAVMVLMLVCLAVFGRVFAICCTSIWWYLAPTLLSNGGAGGEDAARRPLGSPRKSPPPASGKKLAGRRGTREVGSSPRGHTKKGT